MDMDDDRDDNRPFFRGRDDGNMSNRILLPAIISLSFVVVLVILLHLFARLILRRQARRRAALRQLGLIINSANHVHPSEPPKTGLDPEVIASLPILVFREINGQDEASSKECAVCLSILEDGDIVRLLPNCKHAFHAECIDKWLSTHSTCPICRNEAQPRPVPEPHEPMVRAPPSAPPLERAGLSATNIEGTSSGTVQSSAKVSGSSSRLSSFRRMLSRDRSSRRVQSRGQEDGLEDLERQ